MVHLPVKTIHQGNQVVLREAKGSFLKFLLTHTWSVPDVAVVVN